MCHMRRRIHVSYEALDKLDRVVQNRVFVYMGPPPTHRHTHRHTHKYEVRCKVS
jgi:hypothetical protein